MTTTDDLRAHYRARANDERLDQQERAAVREQLERLSVAVRTLPPSGDRIPSRWVHVPLGTLFEAAGNAVRARSNSTLVSGHEPAQGSRSGASVVIWPDDGRWYCGSWRARGDAAVLRMPLHGCTYAEAGAWLAERCGRRTQLCALAVGRRRR